MDQVPSIQQALAAVMGDVREVKKSERNQAQNFNFRGIDAVLNAVGPALRTHGVIVIPIVQDYTYETVEVGKNRTLQGHVRLRVIYRFVGPAGDHLEATVVGEAMDSGDKATAKAMSVCLRTALLQALALPTDEPDPDLDSYERSPAKAPMSRENFDQYKRTIETAATVETLNGIATAAADFQMTDEQRDTLRAAFITRKQALEAQVPGASS